MYILVSGSTASVRRMLKQHPNLGVLLTPADGNLAPERGVVWAVDNGAFAGFKPELFQNLLRRIEERDDCRWVVAPDVVGDHEATLKGWQRWAPIIRDFGQRPAFVAQDGCTVDAVPWDNLACVFIGGSTRFKLGDTAARIIVEGNRRNVWTHMGRVNSGKRIVYAAGLDCRSVDGSSFSRFAETHLRWALPLARTRQFFLPMESSDVD